MKALAFAISILIASLVTFCSDACFADSAIVQKLPVPTRIRSSGPAHTKVWLEEKLNKANALIATDGNNAKLYGARAQLHYELQNYDKCISDITKAISLNSSIQDFFCLRALAHGAKTQYKAAIADFSKSIEIGPERDEIFYQRGYYRYLDKDFAEASRDARKSLSLNSNQPAVHILLGGSELAQKHLQEAQNSYTNAISVDPKNGDAYVLRGGVLKLLGKNVAAQKDLDKGRELGSNL